MSPAVLIVDDSLTARMDLDEAFRSSGFETELCADVAAARRALALRSFNLILLDVLQGDEDGLALLRDLRRDRATASVPIILLSSETEVSDRIRGLATGATDYVGKPYDRGYIVGRARELVRRSMPEVPRRAAPAVLVIDDSATVRRELCEVLEGAGFATLEAASGEEGLRIAFDRRPSAAIVDGLLPGMDGAAVVRRLRSDAVLRRTPCILLTAADGRVGELQALEQGADAYVRKDEGLEVVLARLRALLRAEPAARAPRASSVLGPKRILAVDDSPTYLAELANQLREDGYEVVRATSSAEALRLLAVQEVDCVLLDLMMPGMSGQEACQAIKASPSHRVIPVIVVTAREERDAMIDAIDAGADDFIAKSSHFQVLRARVRAQLRRAQFEEENRALADQERFQQAAAILETVPDAFCAIDREARVVYANGRALELMGRRQEEASGAALSEALGPLVGPRFREEVEQALADRRPRCFLERLRSAGEPWYEVRAFPSEREVILYLRDVTERVKAEEALRESDRRKDEFLAVLSHELRNPLAPIHNGLYVLERSDPASERAQRARSIVARQVGQLTRLVDDLLDVTRINRGKVKLQRERLDLGELVRRTVDDYRSLFAESGIRLEVQLSDGAWIDGDRTRIAQVLGNLLQNSAKFTTSGGKVCVSLHVDADRAVVRVSDDGAGIDPLLLPSVFKSFTQGDSTLSRSKGGLGLGLALVKGLVEQHGGSVSAASAGPGAGAVFTIVLPLERRDEAASGPAPEAGRNDERRSRILVIDDNVDAADSLRDALVFAGHEVETTYGALEGLERACAFRPDVVFCDIGLPDMDGYQVAEAMRERPELAGTRLIALTGYARPEDAARAREAGFDRHMTKPVSLTQIEGVLKS